MRAAFHTAVAALAIASFSMLGISGCAKPFEVRTAPGFIELEGQHVEGYDYRATSPEGVVFSVKVVPDEERGDLDFWVRTLTLKLHDEMGYAVVGTEDVTSLDGAKGKTLKLGHDEGGKPYDYWVTVFVAKKKVFIVEAGAPHELMEKAKPNVAWMLKSVRFK